MMRIRPAGLWPSAARRREMSEAEDEQEAIEAELHGEDKKPGAAAGGGAG